MCSFDKALAPSFAEIGRLVRLILLFEADEIGWSGFDEMKIASVAEPLPNLLAAGLV